MLNKLILIKLLEKLYNIWKNWWSKTSEWLDKSVKFNNYFVS